MTRELFSIIGVKQGDLLGPELFIFFMAAVMITWRSEHSYERCLFRSAPDFVLTGRRPTAGSAEDEFAIIDSEYADDTALPFCSRADAEEQSPAVMKHFKRWGMEVHAGVQATATSKGKDSKSEVLFAAAPPGCYANPRIYDGADLSNILMPGGLFFKVVLSFKYLGSYMASNCSDGTDVNSRVESAGKAFGCLNTHLFTSTSVTRTAKRAVYETLILAILLYGAECWSLTEDLWRSLRGFHARSIRAMSRVTLKHTYEHRLSTQALGTELGLSAMDTYVDRRQLRWLGHVARMDFDERLPRKMLSAWVAAPRPNGAPELTYGRSIAKALDRFNIGHEWWPELAADRAAWRETLRKLRPPPNFVPTPPTPPPEPLARTRSPCTRGRTS